MPVNRAQIPIGGSPFVPNGNTVLFKPFNVRLAPQKPEQFNNNRAQVELFRGQARKAIGQIKAHLVSENAASTRPRAVIAVAAGLKNSVKKVEVCTHGDFRA